MRSQTPKQFLILDRFPVLYYTLKIFFNYPEHIDIIIVLPETSIERWRLLCEKFQIKIPHRVVAGGPTRFHSVKSGLKAIPQNDFEALVAIHDGVRPFVSQNVLQNGFSVAEHKGSAIPVIPVKESLREVSGAFSKSVPRDIYHIVQTPQFFKLETITDAYRIPFSEAFTDDASVFESSGRQITIIEGNAENIKITNPTDMVFAESLISSGFNF